MTNHYGSSLAQARSNHLHRHFHSHHKLARHQKIGGGNHIRSPQQGSDEGAVVVVVRTSTTVHVTDESGRVTATTYLATKPLSTEVVATHSVPVATPAVGDVRFPSTRAPGSRNGSATLSPSAGRGVNLTSAHSANLTSSRSPIVTGVPVSSRTANSTLSTLFANNATKPTNSPHANRTRTSTLLRTSSQTPTSYSLLWTVTSTDGPQPTVHGSTAGLGQDDVSGALPTATPESSGTSDGGGLTPTEERVIGGVIGGCAGIALLAFVVIFLLKWKRHPGGGNEFLGGGRDGLGMGGRPLRPGDSTGGMSRRSLPLAMSAALMNLSGHRRISGMLSEGPEMGERSFRRVAGRKLTSVLQSGGDGYSEPSNKMFAARDSTLTTTSHYRESSAFFDGTISRPLQLGSPMRPESGIMVYNPGPARTPVHEQNPFADPSTPPLLEPLGRCHASMDDDSRICRGSNSRFTEGI